MRAAYVQKLHGDVLHILGDDHPGSKMYSKQARLLSVDHGHFFEDWDEDKEACTSVIIAQLDL